VLAGALTGCRRVADGVLQGGGQLPTAGLPLAKA